MDTLNHMIENDLSTKIKDASAKFGIDQSVGKIDYAIFKSHFANLGLKFVSVSILSLLITYLSFLYLKLPLIVVVILITTLWSLFFYSAYSMRKKLLFDLSFLYTVKTGSEEWWTPITDKIILGGIPLKNHAQQLKQNGITHILTLLQPFEQVPGLITPLCAKTIKNQQIENKILVCQDFEGVPVEIINQAVEYMHHALLQEGKKIYVHCKAGRGRSTSIVVAYLLKYGCDGMQFTTYDEAYAFVKSKRAKVNLKPHQRKTIEDYHSTSR